MLSSLPKIMSQPPTLPSFGEILQQLSMLFRGENLKQLANKVVNLYLPVAYTYVTFRAPIIARIGSYVMSTSVFQTFRKAIMDRISGTGSDCCGKKTDKRTETSPASEAKKEVAGAIVTTGKGIIDKIVDNTITGQVIKALVGKSRGRTEDRIETKEGGDGAETPVGKQPEESNSNSGSQEPPATPSSGDSSPSTGRKVIFPGDEIPNPLPSPTINTRLEDYGPDGWKEAERLDVNSINADTHL